MGVSILTSELPNDLSGGIREFNNDPGFAIDFEVSKDISNHLTIGTDISFSTLNGETDSPNFSANGYHPAFMEPIIDPVEYNNKLIGQKFYLRYYIRSQEESLHFNPFLKIGGGYISYKSKFKYKDAPDDELIFGKGIPNESSSLTTAVVFLGTGFKTNISSNFFLLTTLNFNFVNYDFLDVVHNYSTNGNRIELIGFYSEFKIGIFYNLCILKAGRGKSKKSSIQEYLPFGR